MMFSRLPADASRPFSSFRVTLHPATRIFCLVALAVVLQAMSWPLMWGLLAVLLLVQWQVRWRDFRRLTRRARWLLLSILLIYAVATPGEYLSGWPDCCAPTYEGLQQGALQALRLVLMLAALALVLAHTAREDFIAGILAWLRPFSALGMTPERFAARLWLTLFYVENNPPGLVKRLRLSHWRLAQLMEEPGEPPGELKIPLRIWGWLDMTVMVVACILAGWWLL